MQREHVPPPDALVTALVRAGVSLPTALAMERYKAAEIMELLSNEAIRPKGPSDRRERATI